jgi:hypothetical protein
MDSDYSHYFANSVDLELLRLRSKITPEKRLQSMLDTREILVGFIRSRLHTQYPDLTSRDLNLKVLEEIERAKQRSARVESILRRSSEA